MIGKTLIHYEITSEIGKGGMGEVYQAKDTKLGRDVAIKVLPEEFALDKDRVARFQREAKLLASLNHPNIAAIYGLEESESTHFLVMELIEGDTLRDRIKSGPIPVEEALKLALQMAEALEAAHEKGVIHRDLKPANIKVTPDGKVKILDFGLAKAYVGDQENMSPMDSPTISAAATQQGVILGTAAYMSPEQARGRPVDERVDIWAFGVVLFEMLTGRSVFKGEDISSTLARVLERQPDYSTLAPNLHPRIRFLLERCLEKKARNRYSSISDARVEIQKVLEDPSGVYSQALQPVRHRKKLQVGIPWIAVTAILCLIIAGAAVWKFKPPEPKQVVRLTYNLPDDQQFTAPIFMPLAVSPDGSHFVYCSTGGLYLRSMAEWTAKLMIGAEEKVRRPFFSPDGQWIGYWSQTDRKLKKISVSGGAPSVLCDSPILTGARWYSDNSIIYATLYDIFRVSANGGTPETLVKRESLPEEPFFPQLLPDGKSLLFTLGHELNPEGSQTVVVKSLETGELKELFTGKAAQYLHTGHLIYRLKTSLFAVPFDLDTLEEVSGPISVLENIRECIASDSGVVIYIPGTATAKLVLAERTLVWVDRAGNEDPLAFAPDAYHSPRISPDGTKVALVIGGKLNTNIWVLDLLRETRTALTFDETTDMFPLWTLDSKRIVYSSIREGEVGVYWRATDGTGEAELLASEPYRMIVPLSWSADGKTLALQRMSLEVPPTQIPLLMRVIAEDSLPLSSRSPVLIESDITLLSVEGDRELKPLVADKYLEGDPQISPDGRWIAYVSDEAGQDDVYVRPYPEVKGGRWKISTSGGRDPNWSPDGRELLYKSGDTIMGVPIDSGTAFTAGEPQKLFQGNYYDYLLSRWAIHPNGKQFLMIKTNAQVDDESTEAAPNQINIVVNWFEELKRRVPVD